MAAGKRDSAKSSVSIEDELTCPVCLELFDEPVILPCSHSLCGKCLGEICDYDDATQISHFEKIKMKQNEENDKDKDGGGNKDIDDDDDERDASADVDCDFCRDAAARRAKYSCKQCSVSYCQPCLEQYHPRKGKLAGHTLEILYGVISPEYQVSCDDHKENKVTIFCQTCSVPVCHLCIHKEVGKHVSHEIIDTETAARQQKKRVTNLNSEVVTFLDNLSRQKSDLSNHRLHVETMYKDITDEMDKRRGILIDDLISTLRKFVNEEISHFNKKQSVLITKINVLEEENEQVAHRLASFRDMCKIFVTSHESLLNSVKDFTAITKDLNNYKDRATVCLTKMTDIVIEDDESWCVNDFTTEMRRVVTDCVHSF